MGGTCCSQSERECKSLFITRSPQDRRTKYTQQKTYQSFQIDCELPKLKQITDIYSQSTEHIA